MHIEYVKHSEINKAKWDACVARAPNGYIFSQSFYLDGMCQWDALIAGNYQILMPLPYNQKMGIAYIYHPYFMGQLGIITLQPVSTAMLQAFVAAIPLKFKYVDLDFNEGNPLIHLHNAQCHLRNNYVLALDKPYHLIENNYSKDAKKNLRRAAEHLLQVQENIPSALVISYFKAAYASVNKGITQTHYHQLEAVCNSALQQQKGFTIGLKDTAGNIVAAAFWGIDEKRIYYICGAPTTAGRSMQAQHALIDAVIKKYAGSKLLLDFEGSDIPFVATFYKKFSPSLNQYMHIRMNRLPFWLKWLKR